MKTSKPLRGMSLTTAAVVVCVLIIAAVVVMRIYDRDDGSPAVFLRSELPRPLEIVPVPRKRKRAAMGVPAVQSPPGFLIVPLQYSPPDYGFLIQVSAGDDTSLAVFDTGSSQLALATDDCVEKDLCSAKDAGYDPATSPTAEETHQTANLKFATLEIDARVVNDEVSLFPLGPKAARSAREPGRPAIGSTGQEFVISRRFPVYAATRMRGTRSNVFGFTPSTNRDSVFRHCMDAIGCRQSWAVSCHEDGTAWLCIGDPSPGSFMSRRLSKCHYCPQSKGMSYQDVFILDVKKTRVGPSVREGPDFVVLDTGTSDSYLINVPVEKWGIPDTGAMVSRSAVSSLPNITFYLGNTLIKISPRRYMQRAPGGKFFTCLHKNDPDISAVFPGKKRILLLGIQHMLGLTLHFDIDRQQVGIGKS